MNETAYKRKRATPLADEKRVHIIGRTRPAVREAIVQIATEDGCSLSNTLSNLLETSPRVKRKLREAQTAAV